MSVGLAMGPPGHNVGTHVMDAWMNEAREALLQRRSSLCALRNASGAMGQRLSVQAATGDEAQLSERDWRELRDIDEALVRIAEGRFGHCARCGGAIGRHRLRAVPEARHCMACSGQVER
jgi:DnaK suppressor protein